MAALHAQYIHEELQDLGLDDYLSDGDIFYAGAPIITLFFIAMSLQKHAEVVVCNGYDNFSI